MKTHFPPPQISGGSLPWTRWDLESPASLGDIWPCPCWLDRSYLTSSSLAFLNLRCMRSSNSSWRRCYGQPLCKHDSESAAPHTCSSSCHSCPFLFIRREVWKRPLRRNTSVSSSVKLLWQLIDSCCASPLCPHSPLFFTLLQQSGVHIGQTEDMCGNTDGLEHFIHF